MARKQARVSIRQYTTSQGEKSVGPADGGTVTYTLLKDDGETALQSWKWQGDQMSQFGFVTKVGNVANSVLNGEDPGSREQAAEEINEFLKALEGGVWREPGEGPRGPKYDKDTMAAALHEELGDKAQGDVAHYRAKLEDKGYYARVRGNTAVMARYYSKLGETKDAGTLA